MVLRTICPTDNLLAAKDADIIRTIEDNGVTLNTEKCKFAKTKTQFLGHLIRKGGIEADPSKVEAITQMEAPTKISELR